MNSSQINQINFLRKERLDDLIEETNRLKQNNLINEKIINQMDYTIRDFFRKETSELIKTRTMISYLQGRAVQNILTDTHYTFFHAQSIGWMGYTYLLNAIEKRLYPNTIDHFKFVRPSLQGNAYPTTIQDYANKKETHDHTPQTRNDLISTSSDLDEPSPSESPLYFLSQNGNISIVSLELYTSIILKHYPRVIKREAIELASKIQRFISNINLDKDLCGNLFVFCIPKNGSESVQYRSEPYGTPCRCFPNSPDPTKALEPTENFRPKFHFPDNANIVSHQYRIFAPALDPEKHCVYMFSMVPKQNRKELKEMISNTLNQFQVISENRSWHEYALLSIPDCCGCFLRTKEE